MTLHDDRADYDHDGDYAPNAYERARAAKDLARFEAATDAFHAACMDAARAYILELERLGLCDRYDVRIKRPLELAEAAEGFAEEVQGDLVALAMGWIKDRALRELRETAGEEE